jgi:hypothetical protein
MIPFLQFHALAATRGEGLRPEFLELFKRHAEQAFINPLRSNEDAQQESKVNRLSPKELAERAREELVEGRSTDPVGHGDDSRR